MVTLSSQHDNADEDVVSNINLYFSSKFHEWLDVFTVSHGTTLQLQ